MVGSDRQFLSRVQGPGCRVICAECAHICADCAHIVFSEADAVECERWSAANVGSCPTGVQGQP